MVGVQNRVQKRVSSPRASIKLWDCGDCHGEMETETGRGYLIHVVTNARAIEWHGARHYVDINDLRNPSPVLHSSLAVLALLVNTTVRVQAERHD